MAGVSLDWKSINSKREVWAASVSMFSIPLKPNIRPQPL
jgi:hypothetical protein